MMLRRLTLTSLSALSLATGCRQLLGIEEPVELTADAPQPPGLVDGCVVIEHMDELAWSGMRGEVLDACGGDHPGTAALGLTTVDGGVRGRAGSFNGQGCIDIDDEPALHATSGLTMSAWVRPTALNRVDAFGVVSKRIDTGNASAYNVYIWTNNKVYVDLDGENDRFSGDREIANDVWTQITVVYNGDQAQAERVRVYVDGVLDVVATETSAQLPPFTSPLRVGCLPSMIAVQNFVGLLDEVAVWSRALAVEEVQAWFAMTRP